MLYNIYDQFGAFMGIQYASTPKAAVAIFAKGWNVKTRTPTKAYPAD